MKKIMLIYPPGEVYQRGEDRCQINVESSVSNSLRACNDLGYVASILKDKYKVFLKDYPAEKLAYVISKNNITDYIEFDGYKLIECKVPDAWEGKSLFDMDIRKKYGVSIIAVRSAEGERTVDVSPNPTRKFKCGEMISVVGEDKDIDKFASRLL